MRPSKVVCFMFWMSDLFAGTYSTGGSNIQEHDLKRQVVTVLSSRQSAEAAIVADSIRWLQTAHGLEGMDE